MFGTSAYHSTTKPGFGWQSTAMCARRDSLVNPREAKM